MKNLAQIFPQSRAIESMRDRLPSLLILSILVSLTMIFLIAICVYDSIYGIAAAGALVLVIILQLRWDELTVTLIIAVHVLVDWYFALRLVSLLMALVLLFVCYFGQSSDHPWVKPRPTWLWLLFLTLTIYPAINGGRFDLYDADTFYPSLVLRAFMMFWLGNMIAKDISAVRRVFQLLTVFATLIAIHTIIQATTGKFLLDSARADAILAQNSNYQLVQNLGASISRASSFIGQPNGNATFLACSFFLPLGLFIESQHLWKKLLYLLGMLLILLALMFTYSTGAWIAVLIGILAYLIFVGRVRYGMLLFILITFLTMAVYLVFPSQLALQLSHATANNESSLHIASWQTCIRVIEAFPLFGIGMGGEAYLFGSDPYRVPGQLVPLKEPDNAYLQWGAMAGIPVMLVFLFLLGYVFWCSWRNWRNIDSHFRPLLGGGIVALITLSVNSLSIDGWTHPGGIASLGWLVAGLVASPLIWGWLRQQSVLQVDKKEETTSIWLRPLK